MRAPGDSRWLTMRPIREQGESFLWRGGTAGRWGKEGKRFSGGGKNRKELQHFGNSRLSALTPVVRTPADFLTWW